MQISKFMLVVCAATGAASLSVPAVDTPAQAKARAALEQKMRELDGQPAAATPAPVQPAAEPVSQPSVQVQRADSEAIARARAAMRQRLSELQTPEQPPKAVAAAPATAPSTPTPAPVASSAASLPGEAVLAPTPDSAAIARAREAVRARIAGSATTTAQAPVATATPATATVPAAAATPAVEPAFDPNLATNPNANPAAQAKAQAALRQRMDQLQAQQAPALQPVQVTPVKSGQEMALRNAPGFRPIAGPELPPTVTPEKQQRLLDLLNRYKADQVTPEEYHNERAKILAVP